MVKNMVCDTNIWLVRAGKNGEYEDYFINEKIVGIPFNLGKEVIFTDDYRELKRFIQKNNLDLKTPQLTSKVFTITSRMKIGDYVLIPSKKKHNEYYIGIIKSDCTYSPDNCIMPFRRSVSFSPSMISKESFEYNTRNSLGSLLSIFKIPANEKLLMMLNSIITK